MALAAAIAAPQASGTETRRALVGAIRWDAWHGDRGGAGQAVQRSLGPKRWHYRLPFFATVVSDTQVRIDGASQSVMDREIAYARRAGLDYWAFVTYAPDDPMSLGLKHYLASRRKRGLRFCLITEQARWGTAQNYRPHIDRFVRLMTEPSYQKALGNRPLLYLGFIDDAWVDRAWGGLDRFRQAVDEMRSLARERGAGNPYLVILDFDPQRGKRLADALGADAISAYAIHAGGKGAPYAELAGVAEGFWERCRATGAAVVPIVMSGWDRRPRVEHPVPWETWQQPGVGLDEYYEPPTPAELAAHLKRALSWVDAHPEAAPARAALIYAWNEHDEGGWLVPTLSEGAARLEALRPILRGR